MAGKSPTKVLDQISKAREKLVDAKEILLAVIADSEAYDGEIGRTIPGQVKQTIAMINNVLSGADNPGSIEALADMTLNLIKIGFNGAGLENDGSELGQAPAPLEQSVPQQNLQQGYVRAENGKTYFKG